MSVKTYPPTKLKKMKKIISSSFIGSQSIFHHDKLYGDWRLLEISSDSLSLELIDLVPILNQKDVKLIKLNDIAWRGFNLNMNQRGSNCLCCNGLRFKSCDSTSSGILLEGFKNPGKRKYMCIDGKHRIESLLSHNLKTGTFFILNRSDIENHIKKIRWIHQEKIP